MEIITTEEVMDKLDMFQSKFGKIDEFGSGIWKEFHQIQGINLTPRSSRTNFKPTVYIWC